MKRFVSLILLVSLLLSGCSVTGERIKEPVSFYYLQANYKYGTDGSVIASEEREASGHRNDLLYLMKLYCMGPSDEELVSPLPRGTLILSAEQTEDHVTIKLSDLGESLTDVAYSLAAACLSLTCFSLANAAKVTVTSGERTLTFTQESLQLFDSIPAVTEDVT